MKLGNFGGIFTILSTCYFTNNVNKLFSCIFLSLSFYHFIIIILSLSFSVMYFIKGLCWKGGAFRFFFKKLLWYFHWNMPLSEPLYLLDLALYNTINPLYWEESVSGFLSIRPRQQVLSMGRLVNKMSKFSL